MNDKISHHNPTTNTNGDGLGGLTVEQAEDLIAGRSVRWDAERQFYTQALNPARAVRLSYAESTPKPLVFQMALVDPSVEPDVVVSLARSTSTHPGVLIALSFHSDPRVRAAVAGNRLTPFDALRGLLVGIGTGTDVDRMFVNMTARFAIQRRVAQAQAGVIIDGDGLGSHTIAEAEAVLHSSGAGFEVRWDGHEEWMSMLVNGTEWERLEYASNVVKPEYFQWALAGREPWCAEALAGCDSTAPEVLTYLGTRGATLVRLVVAQNPACPFDVLRSMLPYGLSSNPEEVAVARAARAAIAGRIEEARASGTDTGYAW